MRPILSICFLVLLPWKVNGDTTLRPSVSNQHEGTSEGQGPSTGGEGTSIVSISIHEEDPTDLRRSDGVSSTKPGSQFTEDQHNTGTSHEKDKDADVQITTEKKESFFHSSSLPTVKKQTKRSLEANPQNKQATPVSTANISVHFTTRQERQITRESNSTNKNGVTEKREEMLRSSEKILNTQSNSTSPFPTTPVVNTNEPGIVTAIPQTNKQTKWSTRVQENEFTMASAPDKQIQNTTNLTTALMTTGKDQTHTVPAISDSSTEVNATANSFTTSRSSSTGNTSTVTMETVPTATPTKDMKTTHETVRGTTTTRQASTTRPMTAPAKTQHTEPNPATPQNKKRKKTNKHGNAGPIVAAIIGTVIVLMLIAIAVILVQKRRMQKKQHENTDWAGPSPFLEGDAQPNQPGGDGLFHRRDTKRISLHSFFPLRASQRLSLLMEEEVQMNDIAENSTFGRNEQPQNGKPAVESDRIQTPTTDDQVPAPEVSSSSTVPETGTETVTPADNANIQNPESDETVPKATAPPSPAFEEVKLNAVSIPPAPPLP